MSLRRIISRIRLAVGQLSELSDEELREKSLELKHHASQGIPVRTLALQGCPLVVEASRRCLGIIPHDVQLHCAIEVLRGRIAEMKTGEGKTLTACLAAYMLALSGKGVHLVTFNEYLAKRDFEHTRSIYGLLGLTTDVLLDGLDPIKRRQAYRCDVTFGAAKEFGFDFLRDRLQQATNGNSHECVMRGPHTALVDEADSILIDEARTPLIIGMRDPQQASQQIECYRWAAEKAPQFVESVHYSSKLNRHDIALNAEGISLARSLEQPAEVKAVSIRELYDFLINAIKAHRDFLLDRNYVVRDGEIVIIDEFTGRPAEGRQWQKGIHQAIQAKEGLQVTPPTQQAASITVQSFFRRYRHFAGMTGTAWTSKREFRKIYKKRVVRIPTHRRVNRQKLPDTVLRSSVEKLDAVAASASAMLQQGRPVLIGTRTIGKSEALAERLKSLGLPFQILNANHLASEADIIAQAGQKAVITIATNMAGRGTDIQLAESIRSVGGLHVILTEIHESERIDWQLIGRCSRQGDPGSYQIFVSLDDEILEVGLGQRRAERLRLKYPSATFEQLQRLFSVFRKAQRKTERKHLLDRLILMRSDLEQQKMHFDLGQDPFLHGLRS